MSEIQNRVAALPTVIVTGYWKDNPDAIEVKTCKVGEVDPDSFTQEEKATDENEVFFYAEQVDELEPKKVIAGDFVIKGVSFPNLLTNEEYVKKQGSVCPLCQSEEIEAGPVEIDAGHATQDAWCNNCGYDWTDHYSLSHRSR